MTNKLTESAIEDFAIKLFERLGYDYIHAPDIAPDGDNPERSRYDEVLLNGRLELALKRQADVRAGKVSMVPGDEGLARVRSRLA